MSRKRPSSDEQADFNPEISRGIIAILLFIVAGLALLSFFSLAGVVGIFIDNLLAITFGQVRYVFPFILLVVAVMIVKDLDYDYRSTHIVGTILFFLGFNGLVHLQHPVSEMYTLAMTGNGGGLVGLALAWSGLTYVGYWGATIILVGVLTASIIFIFNTSIAQIIALHKAVFTALGWVGRKIIGTSDLLKKSDEPVKFKIKGDYTAGQTADEEDESVMPDEDEDVPVFQQKNIAKKAHVQAEENDTPAIPPKPMITIPRVTNFKIPSVELLNNTKSKPTSGDIKGNAEVIRDTLHNFGIDVDMGEVRVGPTVTQYSMKPNKGVKLIRITSLSNDLALALAAHPIRIEAPIPGQSLVGIEVPNQKVAMVTLRELIESPQFKNREHNMQIVIGKDVAGNACVADLPKMPHLLVAGTTGSGKTVAINTIILSLLFQNTPETLRLIMVDPKRVELTLYNGIPHLLTPVITDSAKTINALKWTIGEMERRFDTLASVGKRDILSYNKVATEKMPYIVFVIDELADLMATAAADVEAGIIRIAQMARAIGIHLVVATQRPSVEVITGLMKANIPSRMAFSVASVIDSRTILDCPGAEKLLGRGDMLYLTSDMSKPKRIQGAYVSEEEMKEVVNFLKGDEPPMYDDSIVSKNSGGGTQMNMFSGNDDQDPMFDEAKRVVIESGKASASLLQRRMKVGYARAARLLDELEEAGIVGPGDGAKPREVFTEHLQTSTPAEMADDDQTMDAGGTVLDAPAPKESPEEDAVDETDDEDDEVKEEV